MPKNKTRHPIVAKIRPPAPRICRSGCEEELLQYVEKLHNGWMLSEVDALALLRIAKDIGANYEAN